MTLKSGDLQRVSEARFRAVDEMRTLHLSTEEANDMYTQYTNLVCEYTKDVEKEENR